MLIYNVYHFVYISINEHDFAETKHSPHFIFHANMIIHITIEV